MITPKEPYGQSHRDTEKHEGGVVKLSDVVPL